jgi:hypothetical protein
MSNLSANPLAKHFRQPAMYLKLPSQGRWWPEGSLDLPVTGEVPIYPMTARDEITMKTPDALMNGTSTVNVLQSCCPSIVDAWKMPAVDVDPVLIAIRVATYGKAMDFTAVCPHCGTVNEHAIDLTVMLSNSSPADWSQPVKINGLEITLKPQSYEDYNKNNLLNFEEQQLMKLVQDESLSEADKTKQFEVLFQRLIETGISQITKSIDNIKLEDGTVVKQSDYINEFLDNCETAVWDAIKAQLEKIKKQSAFNEITLTCTNDPCSKDFVTPFVFEQSNFFG